MIQTIGIGLLFTCWGSLLNSIGYSLIHSDSGLEPISCPFCNFSLPRYGFLTVISFLYNQRTCRACRKPLALLNPAIELLTAASLMALYFTTFYPCPFFFYALFFSALIITVRTDYETMLISRFVTIFLIPLVFLYTITPYAPVSTAESVVGALFGYGLLYIIAKSFLLLTKKEGLGDGDGELLAFIGSVLGLTGCWFTLFISSITGSIIGLIYLAVAQTDADLKIPFGPFLACGAILYTLLQQINPSLFELL